MEYSDYINQYLRETAEITKNINRHDIEQTVKILQEVKSRNGRIFFLGVGGGAATGSHAANDFNKIAGIPAICLGDNTGILTALANDEGWNSIFKRQLEMHKLNSDDCLFIYSVGGGSETTSKNIALAIDYALAINAKIVGVVGKNTGVTAQKGHACIIVPTLHADRITAHTEDFQMVMDHLIVNLLAQFIEKN